MEAGSSERLDTLLGESTGKYIIQLNRAIYAIASVSLKVLYPEKARNTSEICKHCCDPYASLPVSCPRRIKTLKTFKVTGAQCFSVQPTLPLGVPYMPSEGQGYYTS